jgi:hypothetical protein
MSYKKKMAPTFETEEQEAEYWDTHSPLEVVSELEGEEICVKVPKNRPITIRLDSKSRAKLNRLAAERNIGPSTFARLVLMRAVEQAGERPMIEEKIVSGEICPDVLAKQVIVQEALTRALDGDWQTAISLVAEVTEAVASLPEEHRFYINGQIQMVWLCIQRVSIEPLLAHAEESVQNWDYGLACQALGAILDICQAAGLPLSYEDLSTRIVGLAHTACAAAEEWKSDVDKKLNRVMAEFAVKRVEESTERLEMKPLLKRVVG